MKGPAVSRFASLSGIPGALVPRPKVRRRPKATRPEEVLQQQAEDYLDSLNLFWIHIPKGFLSWIYETPLVPEWVRNLVADYLGGLQDTLILHAGRYLAIELKTEVGKETHGQRDVRGATGGRVCRSIEEFRDVVDAWLRAVNAEGVL